MEQIYEELVAPRIKNTKVGNILKIMEEEENNKNSRIQKKYIVEKVFPYIVLCKGKGGEKRCFTYGDLVMLGKEG